MFINPNSPKTKPAQVTKPLAVDNKPLSASRGDKAQVTDTVHLSQSGTETPSQTGLFPVLNFGGTQTFSQTNWSNSSIDYSMRDTHSRTDSGTVTSKVQTGFNLDSMYEVHYQRDVNTHITKSHQFEPDSTFVINKQRVLDEVGTGTTLPKLPQ